MLDAAAVFTVYLDGIFFCQYVATTEALQFAGMN